MRIGILGGSFDPVHYGHLLLAECCREKCTLDLVWFMPAAKSPHKVGSPSASDEARVEMLKLAVGGHPPFEVSTLELDRGGLSYTVDTLTQIHEQQRGAELFFLMGGDSLDDFSNWRQPGRICDLATLVFVSRPPNDVPDFDALANVLTKEQIERTRQHHVHMPQIELSSSDIRQRVAAGRSIRFQTPRAVEEYIRTSGLYRSP